MTLPNIEGIFLSVEHEVNNFLGKKGIGKTQVLLTQIHKKYKESDTDAGELKKEQFLRSIKKFGTELRNFQVIFHYVKKLYSETDWIHVGEELFDDDFIKEIRDLTLPDDP